jgi:hypothetical protein
VNILPLASFLALLLVIPQAYAEPVSSGKDIFALSFDGGNWKKCPGSGAVRCVLGKVENKQPLLLLGWKNSTTCLVRTKRSFESEWDSGSFPLTFIDTKACPKFSFILAAKVTPQQPYRLLKAESLPSPPPATQREIEQTVRRVAPKFEPSNPQHLLALMPAKPVIFRLPSMESDTYIAVFENSETPGDQVHFLYTNGTVKLIHSAASISSIFSLGNEYYVHYSFTCRVGCGFGGDFVVQFSKADFQLKMFDASTST